MRLKISSDGSGHNTKVTDEQTGTNLIGALGVTRIDLKIETDALNVATLHCVGTSVAAFAEAEIVLPTGAIDTPFLIDGIRYRLVPE